MSNYDLARSITIIILLIGIGFSWHLIGENKHACDKHYYNLLCHYNNSYCFETVIGMRISRDQLPTMPKGLNTLFNKT